MTPLEVQRLLALVVTLDPRLRLDAREGDVRAQAWSGMLADTDPTLAAAAVKAFYEHPQPYPIQVGYVVEQARPVAPRGVWGVGLPEVCAPIPPEVRALFDGFRNRHPALDVPCRWCKAGAGEPCTTDGEPFRHRQRVHPTRCDALEASTGRRVHHTLGDDEATRARLERREAEVAAAAAERERTLAGEVARARSGEEE